MKKEIKYKDGNFIVTLTIPKRMSGEYTYSDGTWEEDAVCVLINEKYEEYTLSQTTYLDYKDSLQATQPIFHFDSKEEALKFAEEYNLSVEYSRL